MKPTEISFRLWNGNGGMRAFFDITFDEVLVVKNCVVLEGKNGLFFKFPSIQDKKDPKKWNNELYIVGNQNDGTPGRAFSDKLTAWILKKYEEESDKTIPTFENQASMHGIEDPPF